MAKTNKELQREYNDRMRALDCVPTTLWVPAERKDSIRAAQKIETDEFIKNRLNIGEK